MEEPTPAPASSSASGIESGFPAGLFPTEAPPAVDPSSASFFTELRTGPDARPFPNIQTGEATQAAPAAERRKPKPPRPAAPEPPTTIPPATTPPEAGGSSSESFFPGQGSFPAPSLTDETAAATLEYTRPAPPLGTPPPVAPNVTAWPSSPAAQQPVVPTITTEAEPLREFAPRPRLAGRDEPPRRNDVSIPRTAVVLWSFFVLLSLIAAFVAGLLLGHFAWN